MVVNTSFNVTILLLAASLAVMTVPVLTVHAFSQGAEVTVFVYPNQVVVTVNQTFRVFVNVSSVLKLQGFDFMLTYDNRILNCTDLQEGTFLSAFGPTFVAKRETKSDFTSTRGRLWLAVCIYGTGFANSSGSLGAITFKALSEGETVLDLYSDSPLRQDEVKLTTCASEPIANNAVDGHVTVKAADSTDPSDPPQTPDVNGDGIVNMVDVSIVALAFDSVRDDARYNARADLDQNGVVNVLDLTMVANGLKR